MHLTHLDLFAGVGMFSLAARWAGIETLAFAEIHPFSSLRMFLLSESKGRRPGGGVRYLAHPVEEVDRDLRDAGIADAGNAVHPAGIPIRRSAKVGFNLPLSVTIAER